MIPAADLQHEYRLREQGLNYVAGLDEAGRGAWAGPVVAGAVILPLDRFDLAHILTGVTDSKLLTPAAREAFVPHILEIAVACGVGSASNEEIDMLGIVPATRLAMRRALAQLEALPSALLTDSMTMPELDLPCESLIKGDRKSLSIAAASILAKVARDQYLDQLDTLHPQYGFRVHKGYGTPLHRDALRNFGPCASHRKTFAPVRALIDAGSETRSEDDAR